mmetsp:Transcript_6148/g.15662  ORF Transcript_6148/g.15662 Transcript_6148/m.15662 type:complete len:236 (-) Transcript_6148:552-1259(-)
MKIMTKSARCTRLIQTSVTCKVKRWLASAPSQVEAAIHLAWLTGAEFAVGSSLFPPLLANSLGPLALRLWLRLGARLALVAIIFVAPSRPAGSSAGLLLRFALRSARIAVGVAGGLGGRLLRCAILGRAASPASFFGTLVVVCLCQLVAPMLKRLPHHRRHLLVVHLSLLGHDLADQVVPPTPGRAGAFLPARDLTRVVWRAPALVEAAVPHKPPVRVLGLDPALVLPESKPGGI